MKDSEPFVMWTVYDHPRDFPNTFVARKFEIHPGETRAMADVIVSPTLMHLRETLAAMGLTPIMRSPGDEAQIVETWM